MDAATFIAFRRLWLLIASSVARRPAAVTRTGMALGSVTLTWPVSPARVRRPRLTIRVFDFVLRDDNDTAYGRVSNAECADFFVPFEAHVHNTAFFGAHRTHADPAPCFLRLLRKLDRHFFERSISPIQVSFDVDMNPLRHIVHVSGLNHPVYKVLQRPECLTFAANEDGRVIRFHVYPRLLVVARLHFDNRGDSHLFNYGFEKRGRLGNLLNRCRLDRRVRARRGPFCSLDMGSRLLYRWFRPARRMLRMLSPLLRVLRVSFLGVLSLLGRTPITLLSVRRMLRPALLLMATFFLWAVITLMARRVPIRLRALLIFALLALWLPLIAAASFMPGTASAMIFVPLRVRRFTVRRHPDHPWALSKS
jgi:hypothetical protein